MLGTGVVGFVCGYELCSLEHERRAQRLLKLKRIFREYEDEFREKTENIREQLKENNDQ